MASQAFPVFVTHVGDTEDCRDRPSHCAIVFWGQKDRDAMSKLQEKMAGVVQALNMSPAPTISDLKRVGCFCVEVNGAWLRARIDKSFTITPGSGLIGLVDVFCMDYGFSQQV